MNWTGSTSDSVLLEWAPPEDNPQCVSVYLVNLNDSIRSIETKDTWINLTQLIPCSDYAVTVSSIPMTSAKTVNNVSSAEVDVNTDAVCTNYFCIS